MNRCFHPTLATARRIATAAAALAGLLLAAPSARAGTSIYVSPSSDASAMPTGWNACGFYNNHQPALHRNLVDSEGNATSVGLLVMSPAVGQWKNASSTFIGDAAEFEPGRSAGNGLCAAFAESGTYAWADQEARMRVRAIGLDPARLYEFSFAAQRYGSEHDSVRYDVAGANAGSASLVMGGNVRAVARVPGIAPLPDGSVEFTVQAADDSANAAKWAYLTALKIEEMDALAAQDIYVDAYPSVSSASKTWNGLVKGTGAPLLDAEGRTTHVWLETDIDPGAYNGNATDTLTGDAAEFDEARAGSNLQPYFTSTKTITVRGLYPDCTYSFAFVASRNNSDTSTRYDTDFVVSGATSGSASLDARSNTSRIARIDGIRPDEFGTATVTISKGAGNTTAYTYLTAFRISRETMTSGDHAVSVSATAGGSVSATVGGAASAPARYLADSETMVASAAPAAGYRFVGWTSPGHATASANPLSIPGTASAAWTAVFERDSAYESKTMYLCLTGTAGSDTKTWNSVSNATFFCRGASQGPFRTSDRIVTDIALATVQPFGLYPDGREPVNGASSSALTGDAADFNAARANNVNYFTQIQWYSESNTNRAYVAYDVTGLKPGRPYTFRFVGSRMGVTDNRSARYWCEGRNAAMATLDAANNTANVATCADVVADEDGTIRMVFSPAPANSNAYLFTHHNALSITGDLPLFRPGTVVTFR